MEWERSDNYSHSHPGSREDAEMHRQRRGTPQNSDRRRMSEYLEPNDGGRGDFGTSYKEDVPPKRLPSKGRGRQTNPRDNSQEEGAVGRVTPMQTPINKRGYGPQDMEPYTSEKEDPYSQKIPSREDRQREATRDYPQEQDPQDYMQSRSINVVSSGSRQEDPYSQKLPPRGDRQREATRVYPQEQGPQDYTHLIPINVVSRASSQKTAYSQKLPTSGDGQREVARDYPQKQDPQDYTHLKPINVVSRAGSQKSAYSQKLPTSGDRQQYHRVDPQNYERFGTEDMEPYAARKEGTGITSISEDHTSAQHSLGRRTVSDFSMQGRQLKTEMPGLDEPQHSWGHGSREMYRKEDQPKRAQYTRGTESGYSSSRRSVKSHDIPAQRQGGEMSPNYPPQYDQRQEMPRNQPQARACGDIAARPEGTTNEEILSRAMQQLDMKNTNRSVVEKRGQNGMTIKLTANYIRLHVEPNRGMFEYEVTFDPLVDALAIRFRLLKEMEPMLGPTRTFDGAVLYLPFQLESEVTHWKTYHPLTSAPVDVFVKFRRQRSMSECTHFYNVLLYRIMNELKLVRLGRQHYNPLAAKVLPQQKLEVWPGYVTSVEEYEGGLMLMCDASHRVLRQQTALEVIYDITRTQFTECEVEVRGLMVGTSVMTRYNNKLYRVDDVSFAMSPLDKFKRNGVEITFVDYYKQQYGLDILVLDQPVLISRGNFISRREVGIERERHQFVVLIPELCYMTGLTDNMRKDHKAMKEVATYTQLNPNQRHYAIKSYLYGIDHCPKARELLAAWGLSMDQDTVELHGRILTGEELHFGNGAKIKVSNQGEWMKAVVAHKMLQVVDLLDWGVIYGKLDHRCTDDFVNTLLHVGPSLGMIVNEPKHVLKLDDDRIDTYMRALKFLKDRQIQIVVLVFPTLRTDRYTAVKYYCNVDAGMSSQVIQTYSLTKKKSLRSTVLSIALQMNCKMGGSLWTTPNPFKSVMVVGIDVYHDTKNRSRSVVGVVSSLNQNLTHYFSQVIYQDPKQELIDGLRHCFIESIRHYFNVNNKFPARIFVFRDGVGDGQLRTLVAYEVEQLINCFPSLTRDEVYEPKFTVVVVQKRINTKIFAARPQDQFENPPPGTVVDHTITKKFMYDFILVSQFAHHGTVNPTHYLVLYDNSQLKPDYLQRFTFKLCHMYFNWMGIIRVPAPCQYAHRLAAHAGLHLKTGFHPVLAERLFYL